ncbi:MAG: HNH endonuclease [Vicinamibacterales bacterium]
MGYVWVVVRGRKRMRMHEHRLVMEQMLGRELSKDESIHHRNGDRTDNRPENLELWASRGHHAGQRAEDLVQHALEVIERYRPDLHQAMAVGILETYAPERLNHDALHRQGAAERLIEETR